MPDHPLPRPDGRPVPSLALRPREAARALGISERALWSLTRDKRNGVPHLRVGRAVLYPTAELRAWLERRVREVRP